MVLVMPDFGLVIAGGVRAERARRQWHQVDLAQRLGWSVSKVSEVETGKQRIVVDDLPLLCEVLGVTLHRLADGADGADLASLGL
jgi:transcriptional regulator with XRE-family HTH domain